MNCRDEVTNRDLQDSYLAMSSKGIENHQKLFLYYGIRPTTVKWSRWRSISWYLVVIMCHGSSLKGCSGHLCTCDVVTDQVPRRLTPSETTLTPVSAGLRVTETREKARPQSVSRGSGWLIINILARQITSAIDGQLLIQHHNPINQARHQTK